MSRIRFTGSDEPSTPPSGKSSLYVDVSDNHLKRKKQDGSVIDYDAGVSAEAIQDAVGSILADTPTIDMTYDDVSNLIKSDIVGNSIVDSHVNRISPTKITDAQNGRYEATVITNDNTPTVIFSLDCSQDGILLVEFRATCRRLGGLSGNPGDGAVFKRTFRVKSYGSSVTVHSLQSDYTSTDNPLMKVSISVSGTDVELNVIGVNNNNLKWNCDIITNINI